MAETGKKKVLVVDDEERIRAELQANLQRRVSRL